jgi:hypothetical protein
LGWSASGSSPTSSRTPGAAIGLLEEPGTGPAGVGEGALDVPEELTLAEATDGCQRGALSVEELRGRRERLEEARTAARARAEELAAQDLDRTRLNRLADDRAAFASTLCAGLEKLDFAGRERLMRLLIERVVVTGEQLAIEHAIPLSGRFAGLRLQHRRVGLPELWRPNARARDDRRSAGRPAHPDPPRPRGRRGSAGGATLASGGVILLA